MEHDAEQGCEWRQRRRQQRPRPRGSGAGSRGFSNCCHSGVLLLGALLSLQVTVHSAEDVQLATAPNSYPSLQAELGTEARAPRPRQTSNEEQSTDRAPSLPAELVDGFPVAGNNMDSVSADKRRMHQDFLDWCRQVLGIETILEIETFEYLDHLGALPKDDDDTYDDDDNLDGEAEPQVAESLPRIQVRGLAATREVEIGETLIRIPVEALFSVANAIDRDPVLRRFLGPDARRRHGWGPSGSSGSDADNADSGDDDVLWEVPLLAVALLHHRRLGASSPLAPYMRMLDETPVGALPVLWDKVRLRQQASRGMRAVARGIQRDMRDMYAAVVLPLVAEHPDLFGNATVVHPDDDDWTFSLRNFQWAYTMVNTRHWQLPIPDLAAGGSKSSRLTAAARLRDVSAPAPPAAEGDPLLPPADTPTEDWVRDRELVDSEAGANGADASTVPAHSFLAPLGDLLNFGPPCVEGRYDADTRTFALIATCPLKRGQEATFWYGAACADIMAGAYGLAHPMVPPCPTAADDRRDRDAWRTQARELQDELEATNGLVQRMEVELLQYQEVLARCSCCLKEDTPPREDDRGGSHDAAAAHPSPLRHEHVRAAANQHHHHHHQAPVEGEASRQRIRKKQQVDEPEGDEF